MCSVSTTVTWSISPLHVCLRGRGVSDSALVPSVVVSCVMVAWSLFAMSIDLFDFSARPACFCSSDGVQSAASSGRNRQQNIQHDRSRGCYPGIQLVSVLVMTGNGGADGLSGHRAGRSPAAVGRTRLDPACPPPWLSWAASGLFVRRDDGTAVLLVGGPQRTPMP